MTEKAFLILGHGSFIQNDVYIVDIDFVVVCLLKLHVKCSTVAGVNFIPEKRFDVKIMAKFFPIPECRMNLGNVSDLTEECTSTAAASCGRNSIFVFSCEYIHYKLFPTHIVSRE